MRVNIQINVYVYIYIQYVSICNLECVSDFNGKIRSYSFNQSILELSQSESLWVRKYFYSCFINPWKLACGSSVIANGLIFNGSPWCASDDMLESPAGLQPSASRFPWQRKGQSWSLGLKWCAPACFFKVHDAICVPCPGLVGFLS